jgi:hypothetical protein
VERGAVSVEKDDRSVKGVENRTGNDAAHVEVKGGARAKNIDDKKEAAPKEPTGHDGACCVGSLGLGLTLVRGGFGHGAEFRDESRFLTGGKTSSGEMDFGAARSESGALPELPAGAALMGFGFPDVLEVPAEKFLYGRGATNE